VKLTGVFASLGEDRSSRSSSRTTGLGSDATRRLYAYFTYDAVWLAAMAILYAGKYDGEAVRAALPVVAERFVGVTGYKAFDQFGDARGSDYVIWQYRSVDGKYKFADIGVWRYPAEVIELTG
jgi:hypothetical protein